MIVKKEGPRALLAGLGPTTWGYLLEGALKFGVYEVLKPVVRNSLLSLSNTVSSLSFLNTQLIAFIACGTISGLAASVVLAPMEALRIRIVAKPDFAPKGWIQGGYKMLKEDGVFALSKGLKAMIYKQVPYTVVKNVSFDFIAKHAYMALILNGIALTPGIKFTVPLVAAAAASILATIGSQPGDMVLSLVSAHGGKRRTRDIFKDIMQSERGIAGFFVGFKTRLLHVGLIVTLQLFLYDFVKRLCGIAATGLS
jgi:solute carrier family 25 phosphate transporter 3